MGRALRALRRGRIGLMGHVYEGMLDMNSDPTMVQGFFGAHVEHLELDDLAECVRAVTAAQAAERLALIRNLFLFPEPGADPIAGPVDPAELDWAARVSVGLEALVEERALSGLAYYYRGLGGNENERLASSLTIGSSLLTGRGVPIAGEYDLVSFRQACLESFEWGVVKSVPRRWRRRLSDATHSMEHPAG